MSKYIVIGKNINNAIKNIAGIFIVGVIFLLIKHTTLAMVPSAVRELFIQQVPKQALSIDPAISDIQLIPGKSTSYKLGVTNLSSSPLGIGTALTDIDGQQAIISTTNTNSTSPLIGWTSLSDTSIIIGPYEKKQITVSITPPTNIKDGGYYEALFLTPIVNNHQASNEPVILSRIGTLIFATVGKLNYKDLENKVHIISFTPTRSVFENRNVTLSFAVKNDYFTHFTAKPFVTITPLVFGSSQTTLLDEKHILPGKQRSWIFPTEVQFGHIIYKAHLTVFIGNGQKITADTYIFVLPYQQIFLGLILVAILFIYIHFRKNIYKAARIFFFDK